MFEKRIYALALAALVLMGPLGCRGTNRKEQRARRSLPFEAKRSIPSDSSIRRFQTPEAQTPEPKINSVAGVSADAAAASAQIDVAQANLENTAQLLEYSNIRVPWDGKITSRMIDRGDFIQGAEGNSAAKPILKLVRDNKIKVLFSHSQNHISGLEKRLKESFSDIAALPDQTFSGTVSRFSAELDPKTRMMRVEMELDNAD